MTKPPILELIEEVKQLTSDLHTVIGKIRATTGDDDLCVTEELITRAIDKVVEEFKPRPEDLLTDEERLFLRQITDEGEREMREALR